MLSKRDLQLVRLAIRWKWITPEQGEDVLFLKRKFGDKLAIEEVVRRRGYVRGDELEQLSEAANQGVGRRGRPERVRPAPGPSSGSPDRGVVPTFHIPEDPTDSAEESSGSGDAKTQGVIRAYRALPDLGRTTFDRSPERRPAGPPVDPSFGDTGDSGDSGDPSDTPELTMVAPLPPSVRAGLLASVRAQAPLDEPDQERTMIADLEQIQRLRRELAAKGIRVPRDFAPGAGKRTPGEDSETGTRTRIDVRAAIAPPGLTRARVEPSLRIPPLPPPPPSDSDDAHEAGEASAAARRLRDQPALSPVPFHGPIIHGEESIPTVPPELERAGEEGDDDLAGGRFGPYAIERVIARGKRGVLYLALDPDQRQVALKVLRPEQEHLRGFLVRLQEQAGRIATIDSPHVVKILDLGSVGGRYYFTTEYVEAWTLEERIDSGDRIDLVESLHIALGVARALAAAERSGVVHGDVNPDNILIGPAGEVLLKGFGLPDQLNLRSTHRDLPIIGTLGYLAPEQAVGGEIDRRSDLYALGATLFHVIAGRRPFEGPTPMAMLARVLAEDAPKLRSIDPSVPEAVADLVDRLLSQDKASRFQSAEELIGALEQLIGALRAEGEKSVAVARSDTRRALTWKAAALSAAVLLVAIGLPVLLERLVFSEWSASQVSLQAAFAGSVAVMLALILISALGLVRRGELPLPMSSAWLVRVQDAAGAAGAAVLVAGIVVGPLALLNVIVSAIAIVVLVSWIYGILLRRTIAFLRPDRGVGRMLAVLGDPSLARWRMVHVPLLAMLASLSVTRLAFLAYFAASGSVLS